MTIQEICQCSRWERIGRPIRQLLTCQSGEEVLLAFAERGVMPRSNGSWRTAVLSSLYPIRRRYRSAEGIQRRCPAAILPLTPRSPLHKHAPAYKLSSSAAEHGWWDGASGCLSHREPRIGSSRRLVWCSRIGVGGRGPWSD